MQLLTIEHMTMFVVKSIFIQIDGQVYGSINFMRICLGVYTQYTHNNYNRDKRFNFRYIWVFIKQFWKC